MNKAIFNTMIFLTIILFLACVRVPDIASGSQIIPGDNAEEWSINARIMASNNEAEVADYLTDPAYADHASVRTTACRQLGGWGAAEYGIGTSVSVAALQNLARTDPNAGVRGAAALASWKISYKEVKAVSGDEKAFLLSLVNTYRVEAVNKIINLYTPPIPFTPISGSWYVTFNIFYGNVYEQFFDGVDTDLYMSLINDTGLVSGTIETYIGATKTPALIYFGLDGSENGYAMHFTYQETVPGQTEACVAIYRAREGQIDYLNSADCIARQAYPPVWPLNQDAPHLFRISLDKNSRALTVFSDNIPVLSVANMPTDAYRGGLALGGLKVWFAYIAINGVNSVKDDSDTTKTPEAVGWAIERLSGMLDTLDTASLGSFRSSLNAILDDTDILASYYLKGIAGDNLARIDFIGGFGTGTVIMDIVNAGLTNSSLPIREWAVDRLVSLRPADLLARLEALLSQAEADEDEGFVLYIAHAIGKETDHIDYPPLEITYPMDGAIVKYKEAIIAGAVYGEPFYDTMQLAPGANTYTKSIMDKNGDTVTQSITINLVNSPPEFIPIGDKEAACGEAVTFEVSATDPDDTVLYYSAHGLPEGATFDDLACTFSWTPAIPPGTYTVTFEVDDGYGLTDSETVTITVNPADYVTYYYPSGRIEWQGFAEANAEGYIAIHYMDRDGMMMDKAILDVPDQYGAIAYEWEYLGLGTQDLVISQNTELAGGVLNLRSLTINAGCMLTIDNSTWLFTTNDPVLNGALCVYGDYTCGAIRGTNVSMGGLVPPAPFENGHLYVVGEERTLTTSLVQTETVHIGAGQRLVIAADTSLLPPGTVTTPPPAAPTIFKKMYYSNVDFALSHLIRTDILFNPSSSLSAAAMPSSQARLSVTPRALASIPAVPPSLEAIPNKTIDENQLLEFRVSGSSPANKVLTYSARNLPQGASFADKTFRWTPVPGQAKTYRVIFTVTDGSLNASKVATVTVNRADRSPVLNPIGDKTVNENEALSIVVQATDPDNDSLTYSARELPQGAEFKQIESLLGTLYQFTWTPVSGQAGTYPVTFTVSDAKLTASETIMITVNKVIVPQADISEKPKVLDVETEPVIPEVVTPEEPVVVPEVTEEPKPAEALSDIEPQAVIQEEPAVPDVVIPEEPAVSNVEPEPVNTAPQPVASPIIIAVPYFAGVTPEITISGNAEVTRPDALKLSITAGQADDLEITGLPDSAEKTIREENGNFYADITYKTEEQKEFDITISATRGIFRTDRSIHVRIN